MYSLWWLTLISNRQIILYIILKWKSLCANLELNVWEQLYTEKVSCSKACFAITVWFSIYVDHLIVHQPNWYKIQVMFMNRCSIRLHVLNIIFMCLVPPQLSRWRILLEFIETLAWIRNDKCCPVPYNMSTFQLYAFCSKYYLLNMVANMFQNVHRIAIPKLWYSKRSSQ